MLLSRAVCGIVSLTIVHSQMITHISSVNTINESTTSEIKTTTLPNSTLSKDYLIANSFKLTELVSNSSVKRNLPYYRELLVYKAYRFFLKHFIYFTSVPGLFTNPLSIYVGANIRPRSTFEFHMIALGITDFFVVFFRLCIHVLRSFKYNWTDVSCKLLLFSCNLLYFFSNWILVTWTIERFVAVLFPLKMNGWCTVNVTKKVLCVAFTACCLVLIPQLIGTSVFYNAERSTFICIFSNAYYNKYSIFDQIVYLFAPTIVITVLNLSIIIKSNGILKQRVIYMSNKDILTRRSKEQRQMILMLLVISCGFFFLHLPQIFAKIAQAIYEAALQPDDIKKYITNNLLVIVGFQITDFQNSINFFLYCAFGNKVRTFLLNKLRRKTNKAVTVDSVCIFDNFTQP